MSAALRSALLAVVGPPGLVENPADQAPYLKEWRGQYRGQARHVVLPKDTQEVAAVVRLCAQHCVSIVPQGGNTGLVGGAVSDEQQVLLALGRLDSIRNVDPINYSMTLDAGCTLATAQQTAASADRLLALSLSSEGSCQIGGNLSTNAGGVNVVKYGGARDQVLGLEVVLADGSVWSQMQGLRKNTAGYDLKQLFVGAEGTLGIITGATLKLFSRPETREVIWASVADHGALLEFYARVRSHFGNTIAAFELIPDIAVEFVIRHVPGMRRPIDGKLHVLIELHGGEAEVDKDAIQSFVGAEIAQDRLQDAVVAQGERQRQALWAVRHNISEAQRHEGVSIKHDIAVPISALESFVTSASAAVERSVPGVRIVCFGHIGDGNLHFNLSQPIAMSGDEFRASQADLTALVHEAALGCGGTVSAEHGIGLLKRDMLAGQVGSLSMTLMHTIKRALDPHNLMNPGKVI